MATKSGGGGLKPPQPTPRAVPEGKSQRCSFDWNYIKKKTIAFERNKGKQNLISQLISHLRDGVLGYVIFGLIQTWHPKSLGQATGQTHLYQTKKVKIRAPR